VRRYGPNGIPTDSVTPPYLYPIAGLPKVVTVESPAFQSSMMSGLFSRRKVVDNHWGVSLSAVAGRPFPVLLERNTTIGDVAADQPPPANFQVLDHLFEEITTDAYGNVVEVDEVRDSGRDEACDSRNTTISFTPNASTWLISNPEFVHVSVLPDTASTGTIDWDPEYDTAGLLKSITRSPGTLAEHKTTIGRDAFGNPQQLVETVRTGESARTTDLTYDTDSIFPLTVSNSLAQMTQVRVDSRWGTTKTVADPNGIVLQRAYDDFGRLVETRKPTGTTVYTYSPTNASITTLVGAIESKIAVQVDRLGASGSFGGRAVDELDTYGRVVRSTLTGFHGEFVMQERAYDSIGRTMGATLPHSVNTATVPFTTFTYDPLNQLTEEDHSDGTHIEHRRASRVSLATQQGGLIPNFACPFDVQLDIDEEGRQDAVVRDHRGLVIRSYDGNNTATAAESSHYEYDGLGQLIAATDNLGSKTTFMKDAYGRVLSTDNLEMGTTGYTYDGYDEIKTSLDAKNQLRSFTFDTLGRMATVTDGTTIRRWTYDEGVNAIGRLSGTSVSGLAGQSTSYTYEPATPAGNRGLLQNVTYNFDGVSYPVGFTYDELGRTQQTQYPDLGSGQPIVTENDYDPLSGALQSVDQVVGVQRKKLWQLDTAFQGHLVKDESFGNGAFANYGHDDQRYWVNTVTTNLGSDHIQGITYSHYNNGLVKDRQDEGQNPRRYGYDNLNRLASITDFLQGGGTNHFDLLYDDQGNVERHPRGDTFGNVDLTYRTDRPRLVDTVTTSNGTNAYSYDANGNVNQRTGPDIPDGAQTIDWTPFDLPQRVANASNTKVTSFEYSADERRTIQRGPDSTRYYITDLYERVAGASAQDTLEERFRIYAGGRVIGEIVRAGGSDQILYFHADHLGSIDTISTNAAPPQVSHQRFDAFGASVGTSSSLTRASFTGQERDDDLGLIDMKGRVYDPLAGRFTSADPLIQNPFSSQGLNPYSYVFNNPVNYVDPSGLMSTGEWIAFIAVTAIDVAALAYGSGFDASSAGDLSAIGSAGTLSGIAGNTASLGLQGIPKFGEGGASKLTGSIGGNEGAGGSGPGGSPPPPFDPGPEFTPIGKGRFVLSQSTRARFKPVYDKIGGIPDATIEFGTVLRGSAETDYEYDKATITIDRNDWQRADYDTKRRLLAHEFVHPLQYQKLGRFGLWQRHLGETLRYGRLGQYDVPDELLKIPIDKIDVVDPRFPLEAIAEQVSSFLYYGP
jgi:RHS repeat-associated protein